MGRHGVLVLVEPQANSALMRISSLMNSKNVACLRAASGEDLSTKVTSQILFRELRYSCDQDTIILY